MSVQIVHIPERTAPTDLVIQLNQDWALCHDDLQWIILQWRGDAQGWRPRAFVSSSKHVVRRVLDELGVVPRAAAKTALDRIPNSFATWKIGHVIREDEDQ